MSAPAPRPVSREDNYLHSNDLLGSFEDLHERTASLSAVGHRSDGAQSVEDLLEGGSSSEAPRYDHSRSAEPLIARTVGVAPIHVSLPPRPSEISPDYAPPVHSPPHLSRISSFPGPSSPPSVSNVGRDIIFHPAVEIEKTKPNKSLSQSYNGGSPHPVFNRHSKDHAENPLDTPTSRGPAQTKLLNALTNTAKLASKWKSVIDPIAIAPSGQYPNRHHYRRQDLDLLRATAQPIDVTHFNPFASPEQIAGSYTGPSGAPGYDAHLRDAVQHASSSEDDFGGTTLRGRRAGTVEVLSRNDADKVRPRM